ncbi:hypothetical protein BACCAP_03963 [Pseudoflavonifractor capillosus ATCC 29799]|uniref:Uncharacterized protein n=1 Tax=Pseudoflavonifractor capillosus ATCC 29799 TaxID=411467 RepID=A6P0F2_9FIRM|nr:hypothetical protein BACCAP_03963 [Pseudoflavonifractor capillosus ATCC 29799]
MGRRLKYNSCPCEHRQQNRISIASSRKSFGISCFLFAHRKLEECMIKHGGKCL